MLLAICVVGNWAVIHDFEKLMLVLSESHACSTLLLHFFGDLLEVVASSDIYSIFPIIIIFRFMSFRKSSFSTVFSFILKPAAHPTFCASLLLFAMYLTKEAKSLSPSTKNSILIRT